MVIDSISILGPPYILTCFLPGLIASELCDCQICGFRDDDDLNAVLAAFFDLPKAFFNRILHNSSYLWSKTSFLTAMTYFYDTNCIVIYNY